MTEVQALIKPAVIALGYEFIGCELAQEGHRQLLRIYVDNKDGITVDDCARVSQQVSAVLDVEDPFVSRYQLEVSSPGLDRPLFTLEHYQQFVGHKIRLCARVAKEGRRRYTGQLMAVEDGTIILTLDDGQRVEFVLADIEKANIIADV